MEHDEAVDRLRRRRRPGVDLRHRDLEQRPAVHGVAAGGLAAVDADPAAVDQRGGGGAGEAEQPRQRDVEPQPVQPVGHRQQAVLSHRGRRRPTGGPAPAVPAAVEVDAEQGEDGGEDRAARDAGVGEVEDRAVLPEGTEQADPVDDVTRGRPRARGRGGRRGCPGAAEHQAERDRPAGRAHPGRGAHDDDDHDDRDRREHRGEAGAERERRAGVAGLVEVERAAEQPHRQVVRRQLRHHDHLGDDVQDEHRERHRDEHGETSGSGTHAVSLPHAATAASPRPRSTAGRSAADVGAAAGSSSDAPRAACRRRRGSRPGTP